MKASIFSERLGEWRLFVFLFHIAAFWYECRVSLSCVRRWCVGVFSAGRLVKNRGSPDGVRRRCDQASEPVGDAWLLSLLLLLVFFFYFFLRVDLPTTSARCVQRPALAFSIPRTLRPPCVFAIWWPTRSLTRKALRASTNTSAPRAFYVAEFVAFRPGQPPAPLGLRVGC